jgi:putative transposase
MAWQKAVLELLNNNEVEKVSKHLSYGWPLAGDVFLKQLALKTSRPLQPRLAGRPKKPL